MRNALPFLTALALATPVVADEVLLEGGGTVRGRVLEQTETHVVVEVGPGRVTLPASRVVAIRLGKSALDEWYARSARLAANDADGWLALGLWARDHGLYTQAREAFERVLVVQPHNPIANAAVGRVRLGDRWVSEEESYLARGFVRYRGRWITREEHAATLAERRAEIEERTRRAEADARVREAEARARAAEARADAAEQAPAFPGPYSYSPFGLVIGSGGSVSSPQPPVDPPPPPPQPPPPRPRTRTGSWH